MAQSPVLQAPGSTGYARLTPLQAWAVLAGLISGAAILVGITLSPFASGRADKPPRHTNDVELYQAEVERIQQGEGYYDAAAAELIARGYPTSSVFNWRTPLPMWLIGRVAGPLGAKALLCLLGALVVFLTFEAMAREVGVPALAGNPAEKPPEGGTPTSAACRIVPLGAAVLLTGPLLFCLLQNLYVTPVLWSGVLLALSLVAYGIGRVGWGVALGILALVFRELALPYCLLSAGLAWRAGRRRELAAWILGIAGWLAFYGVHVLTVLGRIPPNPVSHTGGWVQFGGAPFVVAIAQMSAYLLLLPQWVTAVYFAAAMFGLAGWTTPWGRRVGLTGALYVAALSVVGYEFNQYWGLIIAPVYCTGVARFPVCLADLCRRLW